MNRKNERDLKTVSKILSYESSPILVAKSVKKQGRIHGNPVADSWAGAVMQKPLGFQKCDGWTDLPTYRPTDRPTDTARWRVACPRLIRAI